jgi:hypothetical protein
VFHSEQGKVTDAGNQQAIRPSHAALLQLPQVASATDTASGTVPIASYVPLIMFAVLFGLSGGVALAALSVLLLAPALLVLAAAWWCLPAWLDRALPHLDIEGRGARRVPPAARPEAGT